MNHRQSRTLRRANSALPLQVPISLARIPRTRNRQRGDRKFAAGEMEKAESLHLSTLTALERSLGTSALGISLKFVTSGSSMESHATNHLTLVHVRQGGRPSSGQMPCSPS